MFVFLFFIIICVAFAVYFRRRKPHDSNVSNSRESYARGGPSASAQRMDLTKGNMSITSTHSIASEDVEMQSEKQPLLSPVVQMQSLDMVSDLQLAIAQDVAASKDQHDNSILNAGQRESSSLTEVLSPNSPMALAVVVADDGDDEDWGWDAGIQSSTARLDVGQDYGLRTSDSPEFRKVQKVGKSD